jgi:NAD(P)-dependent dehydrogenase (short-subunit alcohol dehydrogenase family)
VRGTFLVTQSFLNLVGTEKNATIVSVSTGAALGIFPGVSAYSISKLATIQLGAYIAAENPNITSITIHPGVVRTAMVPDTSPFSPFADDEANLSGGLAVWLATDNAKFLNERYVNAN